MTDAYIFDFGQVLVHFDERKMTADYIADARDVDLCQPVIFDRLYWDRLDAGAISDEEVRAGIRSRLPQRLHEAACLVYDRWFRDLSPIAGMPEILRDLKAQGKKLYLLSNISARFAADWQTVPNLRELLSSFDGLVFSAPLHMVKPHPEIFLYLLDRYRLRAEACTFVDDREKNIAAARQLGMDGYLFDGSAERLRAFLFRAESTL